MKRVESQDEPASAPLPLYQVLEEECVAILGTLPPAYQEQKAAALAAVHGTPPQERTDRLNAELVPLLYAAIHQRKIGALCLSGGGIRSATFGLGVVQGLARHGLLDQFDYLSTVSGGGYLGSWLSAWVHRHGHGLPGVVRDLSDHSPRPLIDPEPPPIRHLRAYSNYLTPKLGLFSADAWTLIATYLRNLFLNWLVILPAFVALLAVPRLGVALTVAERPAAILSGLAYAFLGLGFLCGVGAAAYIFLHLPSVRGFRQQSQDQDTFLAACLAPLVLSGIFLSTFWAWFRNTGGQLERLDAAWPFLLFGVLFHVTVWLVCVLIAGLNWERPRAALVRFLAVVLTGFIGGFFAWLVATKGFPDPRVRPEAYVASSVPLLLLLFLTAGAVYTGVVSRDTTDQDREWWSRSGGWILMTALVWLGVSSLTIYGPTALYTLWQDAPVLVASVGGVSGLITIVAGFSARSPANKKEAEQAGWPAVVTTAALYLAAPVFAVLLIVLLSLAANALLLLLSTVAVWILEENFLYVDNLLGRLSVDLEWVKRVSDIKSGIFDLDALARTPWWLVLALMMIMTAVSLPLAQKININKFSLHGIYRIRLIRAYLGASRAERRPNPFTGFDPDDNLAIWQLRSVLQLWVPRTLDSLVASLRRNEHPLSDYLRGGLSEGLWMKLAGLKGGALSDELRAALIADLKRLLPVVRRTNRNAAVLREYLMDTDEAPIDPAVLIRELVSGDRPLGKALRDRFPQHLRVAGAQRGPLSRDGQAAVITEISTLLRSDELTMALIEMGAELSASMLPLQHGDESDRLVLNKALLERLWAPKLFHVVNMALNLVKGEELAWQQRKAESFTVTPLHCGNARLGYRRAEEYGQGAKGQPITLGTAIAISGAAASPNMGYHSSPAVTFLMTLFNARLGWWLGNPGSAGQGSYRQASPRSALAPMLAEAFGRTSRNRSFVYLSDGGHFENLGLYEMVLRRCHCIVVVDAGRDPACVFEDLGNAIRKIRVDLGVRIDIKEYRLIPPRPVTAGQNGDGPESATTGKYCAVGTIRYSAGHAGERDGFLLYIKPALCGTEPVDVFNYASANEDFPHESTGDQWFSESQFESYRMLGFHTLEEMVGPDFDQVCAEGAASGHGRLQVLQEVVGRYLSGARQQASQPVAFDHPVIP